MMKGRVHMPVRSSGEILKEARINAGLTQEQFSEGICSSNSLARIERGELGVSASTFQALLSRVGITSELMPCFASREDFECYYLLKKINWRLEHYQLKSVADELQAIKDMNWANNKYYFQEWILYRCISQVLSFDCDYDEVYEELVNALYVSRESFDFEDFKTQLLSQTEINLLLLIEGVALICNKDELVFNIHNQLRTYIINSTMTFLEKDFLLAKDALVYTGYLMRTCDYEEALKISDRYRHLMVQREDNITLMFLTFEVGLCHYQLRNLAEADNYIKVAYYSSHGMNYVMANYIKHFLEEYTDYEMTEYMKSLPDIIFEKPILPTYCPTQELSEPTFNYIDSSTFTIGDLIYTLRTEQKLSQSLLCKGLCSTSKLSKIENGTLQPDIILVEALLQRLGISERIFGFWGNKKEAELYELKYRLIYYRLSDDDYEDNLKKMRALITPKDHLYYQDYLVAKSVNQPPEKALALLKDALDCTLPEFDFQSIKLYRLTWEELCILNLMCKDSSSEPYLVAMDFQQIVSYVNDIIHDPILFSSIAPKLYTNYIKCLSIAMSATSPMIFFETYCSSPVSAAEYGFHLFIYSQTNGENNNLDDCYKYGVYSCNLQALYEFENNSKLLMEYITKNYLTKFEY